MHSKNYTELLQFANTLADASGEVLRRWFTSDLVVESKADTSPVTLADKETEKTIRSMIEASFPEHGIIGEEFGNVRENSPYQWVIDPIDGTKAFIAKMPTFTTLIALFYNGTPLLGIIDQPILRERFSAAVREIKKIAPTKKTLAEAHIATTSTGYFTPAQEKLFEQLKAATNTTSIGGDAYAYAQITTGKYDIVLDAAMKPYDYCALIPVIEAAGGVITDWKGKPLTLTSDGTVLAAVSEELHSEALKLLSK